MPRSALRPQAEAESREKKTSSAKKPQVKAQISDSPEKPSKAIKAAKDERLDVRLTSEQKELLQRAAVLEGCSMTDFVSRAVQAASLKTVERHQALKLGIEDSIRFVETLLNPPEPNENLKEAFRRYHDAIGNSHK